MPCKEVYHCCICYYIF